MKGVFFSKAKFFTFDESGRQPAQTATRGSTMENLTMVNLTDIMDVNLTDVSHDAVARIFEWFSAAQGDVVYDDPLIRFVAMFWSGV